MDILTAEARFISVLNSFNDPQNEYVKRLQGFAYLKESVTSKSRILKCFDTAIRDIRYVKEFIKGKEIIDAGCGEGAFSILLGILGAKKVYAVDFISEYLEVARFMVKKAGLDNVETVHSDIAKLNLPEESIDGVFSIEAISHYKDYKSFLQMASKVLRTGGFLVIRDENNSVSPWIRRRVYKFWDAWENYPKPTIISGHKKASDSCFLYMRKEIIRNEFPRLSEDKVEKYAKYTFAYSKENIILAVKQFIKGDFSLRSEYVYRKCPLDPKLNWYIEQMFNPFALKRELKKYGFESRVKSTGPANRDLKIICYIWEFLSPITIYLPRGYQLIARKI